MFEQRINIDRMEQAAALFGSFDANVRLLEKEYGVSIVNRFGNQGFRRRRVRVPGGACD